MWCLILFFLILLLIFWAWPREHLAPMLKAALEGQELSYKSNVAPGFRSTLVI